MFCIAAFIVFAVLSIFSATYRPLAKAAWHCTWRRITFRPCDISFNEEMRAHLFRKLIFRAPRLTKFLDRWLDWISFVFVALSIWSVVYLANAGLNYWVYGTCDPRNVESCTLSGEACGVDQIKLGLVQAVREGRMGEWSAGPFVRFAEAISRVPDRLKTWNAEDFLAPTATFFAPKDTTKPYVLEIVDPGCTFCRKLTHNLWDAGVASRDNMSYLLYPIPKPEGGYKFAHSLLVASVIEATKQVPLLPSDPALPPPDWQLLELLFALPGEGETDLQSQLNLSFTEEQARAKLRELLGKVGFAPQSIERIMRLAASEEIQANLAEQKRIAEEDVRTIKIPTLIMNGRRYDRVVSVEKLK